MKFIPQRYWKTCPPVNIITTGTAREKESQERVLLVEDLQQFLKISISEGTINNRSYFELVVALFSGVFIVSRQRVIFTGRVQGVGFRHSTKVIAQGFEVTGFVRNQDDGTVEMVAGGEASEVDRFIVAVQEQMSGLITNTRFSLRVDHEQFTGFTIRY
ncbi:MAG: acylphosphatase [Planctomycetota bacterium]|nr:acylphosphatase [Planctomycetota bacterium]